MRAPLALVALVAGLLPLVAGCGQEEPAGGSPDAAPPTTGPIRLVAAEDADLHLYVSNQSFDDPDVRITVEVDGVLVVDDDFAVEGQHTWISFPLALPPGAHRVTATSDSGAELKQSVRVPRGEDRYAVVEHWTEAGEHVLTWFAQREPIGFA
ncbi:hypothetical protein [Nocardioides deserti]|uniref:EfeO-type cupredoxin-like domain-containing protein n=1 Tax=Nocardioides deserti TaxID=1588644 RepID=A0ABR6U9W3_9ACTN|nr:hypothetical protein [Nocardioides deserti]MBC2961231.1 hypothetical protein [Nocardioides deserti]GGO72134.1 hypothetical protein GCM10012276_14760 [Nocardioides deserti]